MQRRIALILLLLCSALAASATEPQRQAEDHIHPGIEALADLEYKREVLMYCGISDSEAVRGFLDHQTRLVEQHALTRQMSLDAASQARQAAYAEWQNRGLGGFRGWCRDEGKDYAAILRGYRLDSGVDISTPKQGLPQ